LSVSLCATVFLLRLMFSGTTSESVAVRHSMTAGKARRRGVCSLSQSALGATHTHTTIALSPPRAAQCARGGQAAGRVDLC
jgi:hypothetical protein